MKASKILKRLTELLDNGHKTQAKEIKTLQKLLKKLKEKERALEAKLESTEAPDKRESLRERLEVIYLQRRKGIERLRELKEGDREKPPAPPETPAGSEPSPPER